VAGVAGGDEWQVPGATAVVVPVPEAERVIGDLRRKYTPSGRDGMPAHATLLVPFVPASELEGDHLDRIAETAAAMPRFAFTLARLERFPEVLYLAPDPERPFAVLIKEFVSAFPEYPPYGADVERVVPHVTVASPQPDAVLDALSAQLAPQLPIAAVASELHLVVRGEDGCWRTHTAFELPPPG
jgi:2'-5' RNA ligase